MIAQPITLAEIDKLIADQVQESLHLDYKDSGAIHKTKKDDISKDVSAFANSDGGIIIYGVREKDFLPTVKNGVDHTQYKREWLEQIIWSNISPIVDDVKVVQFLFRLRNQSTQLKCQKVFVVLIKRQTRNTINVTTRSLCRWKIMKIMMSEIDGRYCPHLLT